MKKKTFDRIVGVFTAMLLVMALNIPAGTEISTADIQTAGIGYELVVPEASMAAAAECVCAERRNWLGFCRGETTRLCKGDSECDQCGVGDDNLQQN